MPTSASGTANEVLDGDIERLRVVSGCQVEILLDGAMVGIIVQRLELPSGVYNKPRSDLMLQATVQYPASAMDMFWAEPDLLLSDGSIPAGAESMESHFGRQWRRFSWHRNAEWLPGRDDLVGHFEFAVARLQRPQ